MRLLADENLSPAFVRQLRNLGHDVLATREVMRGASDNVVLHRAITEHRILLTLDKDFGELAFRSRLPASCGIVLIRMTFDGGEEVNLRILAALTSRNNWSGSFWVISDRGIRERPLPVVRQ